MKYKVGDKTKFGEIIEVDTSYTSMPYLVEQDDDTVGHWFTESEIDAIVIKPKRNIDHLIELWDGCKADKACRFMYDNIEWNKRTLYNVMFELFKPYVEPRKHPVLTPEELKAVKWLVDGGYEVIELIDGIWPNASCGSSYSTTFDRMPIAKCLRNSAWITETPINLKELLEAQEDV